MENDETSGEWYSTALASGARRQGREGIVRLDVILEPHPPSWWAWLKGLWQAFRKEREP